MLINSYEHVVDVKGRVFIPAKWREDLGNTVVVTKGLGSNESKCLFCMSLFSWQELLERSKKIPLSDIKAQKVLRGLFSNACECDTDKQGRILISNSLREYAGIDKDAVLVGMVDRAEIWSAQEWKNYCADGDELTNELLEHLMGLGI